MNGVRGMEKSLTAQVVCVGNDVLLLQTRGWILERRFRVTTAKGLTELAAQITEDSFDVLILCQTLSMEECEAAMSLVHSQSPSVRIMRITKSRSAVFNLENEMRFDQARGPQAFLDCVSELVCSIPEAQRSPDDQD
jgi:hypothetical protein